MYVCMYVCMQVVGVEGENNQLYTSVSWPLSETILNW